MIKSDGDKFAFLTELTIESQISESLIRRSNYERGQHEKETELSNMTTIEIRYRPKNKELLVDRSRKGRNDNWFAVQSAI